MKLLLQAIKSLLRKVENTAERVLNFFGGDGIIKQEHLPDGYPYGEIVEILPETTIEIDTLNFSLGIISTPFTLVPGNEYIVAWNGTEYVCTAQEYTADGATSIAIGNIEGNTAEPFSMVRMTADTGVGDELVGQWAVVAHDDSVSATISIVEGGITKMDVKYLPDEAALKSDLEGLGGGGGGSSNEVSTSTATNITGILKGNGSKVAAAVAGTDYAAANHTHSIANVNNLQSALNAKQAAPSTATALPSSGTALTANTIYNVSAAVGTYAFTAPATGWAHGYFATGASASVSFSGQFLGAAPSVEASKTYEFDVYNGVWAVQEVVSA